MKDARKTLVKWAFLLVPAAGVMELGAHFYFASRPPAFTDYASLEAPLRDKKRPGELIVTAPLWADPLVRGALGDGLLPMRDAARPDVTRYASALEISVLGERSDELTGFREEERFNVGKFVVRRMVNPSPAKVLYDFVDHAVPTDADVRGTAPELNCTWNPRAAMEAGGFGGHPTWPSKRFECGQGTFFFVGETIIADQNYRPRRCLWAHPLAHGELVVRYHDVPLGDVIHGHGGLQWMLERDEAGAPVTLAVRVDGDEIGRFTHEDGQGWRGFEMPLGKHARAEKATVEMAITTPNYRDRHFCFEADTR